MELPVTRLIHGGPIVAERALCPSAPGSVIDSWVASTDGSSPAAFVDMRVAAGGSSWGGVAAPVFPDLGDAFLGFRVVAELGRGAFGRVYLARQDDLAQRLVALKVSTEVHTESQNLAQLQHTHIVPVYSVHRAGALHAVCMPYLGSATLADVLRDLQRRQTPPASARGLVSTIQSRVGRTRANLGGGAVGSGSVRALAPSARLDEAAGAEAPAPPPAEVVASLRVLEGLTHVEAVLWIGERLAEALAHAHERGILHGDLKPANILLTDDGQPMLLDFNLSTDVKADASRAHVGGTLPYMAPEHLAAFARTAAPFPPGAGAAARADARSDVYSLGVVLYELLTGQAPFKLFPVQGPDVLAEMLRSRLGPPPRVRTRNRNVSPAVEAIVRHCLEPDPGRRYRSARQLAEDLERHRRHLPLAHASEASLGERGAKWLRRNGRRAALAAGLAGGLLILSLAAGLASHGSRLVRVQDVATLTAFRDGRDEASLLIAAPPEDAAQRLDGLRIAREALARYDVLADPAWRERPGVLRLLPDERQRLVRQVGELLLMVAGSEEPDRRGGLLDRAADCFPDGEAPGALDMHRAALAEARGDAAGARALREAAAGRPARNATDLYLLARERADAGAGAGAVGHLREAVRRDPKHFPAWFMLGSYSLDGTAGAAEPEAEAVRCFSVCVALRPAFASSYYNRGLALLRQKKCAEAEADFTAALELRPGFAAGHLYRGLACEGQGKPAEALADLDQVVAAGDPPTRALFTRARLRGRLGDARGSESDHREGLHRRPHDAENFVCRGVVRMDTDPAGALADFQEAVRLNPRSLAGLYNQALILGGKMNRPRQAVEVLDRVVHHYPSMASARAMRGVLRARLGRREGALEDGHEACRLAGTNGQILYQAACIRALTSRGEGDRTEALRLLSRALRLGFGHDRLESNPDLEPLREEERFHGLVEGVKAFLAARPPDRPIVHAAGGRP